MIGVNPFRRAKVMARLSKRQLELGPLAGQVVEPGAGDLRPPLHVDRAEQRAELEVILGLEALGGEVPRRAVGLQHHVVVLPTEGDVGEHQIADLAEHLVEGQRDLALGGVGLLDQISQLLGPPDELVALLALSSGDLLAQTLLLGPQLLILRDRVAPGLVGGHQVVDQRLGLAPGALGRADPVGIAAEDLWVDHRASLASGSGRGDQVV